MNSPIASIRKIQEELEKLSLEKSFSQAQRVIFSVIELLDPAVADKDPESAFQLFTDSDGKIRANAGWFFEDKMIADRKAVYKIHGENALGIDFKAYGVNKASKRIVSWATGVTPNFEDEAFNGRYNVGIDFVVPKSCDRVIVVLTNNYVVRTLELKGTLTATYQEILAKWAAINDFSSKKAFHSILWESFDLQPLNKKFYAGISERFILLRQHLEKEGIFDQKHASYFSNRLMGRVIFCWFLDHKNVLNAEKKYFDAKAYPSSTDYYRGRLETLFYRVLNTPVDDRELMVQDDATPFLNGGLFEPRATDLFENPKLTFPKNYFDDLFEFLSGYNFTTDESTSQFQQVAIDPEMLGRIFENLLAEMTEETGEQARKAKGAFYTPREIVDYMCRESLREYLKTKIAEDEFRDKRLEQLIDRPDKEFQDQDHNWRRDWKPYKDAIIKALDELTVLDPACGSGAFPIGMLQLLVQVYERLESRFDSYRTKLQIIEKNLYGVDIEPMAVEIARLRAWLSIIVDEDADSKKIKPLPNLEFKFICANSLIDLDQNSETPLGGKDHNVLAEELRTIRDAYFNTESLNKKKSLREKYNKLINEQEGLFGESKRSKQLKTYRPFDNEWSAGFFNPEFMFGVEKFNVIIGNPPYAVSKDQELRKIYAESIKGRANLYGYFIHRAIADFINKDGILAFINPRTLLTDAYFAALRKWILKNAFIYKILNIVDRRSVFEAVLQSVVVNFFKKSGRTTFVKNVQNKQEIFSKEYLAIESEKFKYEQNGDTIFLVASSMIAYEIFEKLERLPSLSESGFEFVTGKVQWDKFKTCLSDQPGESSVRIIWGENVQRYNIAKAKLREKMIYLNEGCENLPPLIKRETIAIQRTTAVEQKWRIIAAIVSPNKFGCPVASENGTSFLNKYSTEKDLRACLGILSSRLFDFIFRHINSNTHVSAGELNSLPYPIASEPNNGLLEKIADLVDQITKQKESQVNLDTSGEEGEIDQLVYQLYGLTDEEIKIVEDNAK